MKKIMILLSVAGICGAYGADAAYEAYKKEIMKDDSLIRFWTFEEGYGREVVNHVEVEKGRMAWTGGPAGSLTIYNATPWGYEPRTYTSRNISQVPRNEWTIGRFDGKSGIRTGETKIGLFRSGITGEEFANGATCCCWVRFEDFKKSCRVMKLGSGNKDGFQLSFFNGWLNLIIGGAEKKAEVAVNIKDPDLWHHIAWTVGDGKARVYVDGKLAGEKPFENAITPIKYTANIPEGLPFLEQHWPQEFNLNFVTIGANPRRENEGPKARVHIDELAFYKRSLAADSIARIYDLGKVADSREVQREKLASWLKHNELMSKIELSMPVESDGFFRVDKTVPIKVALPAELSGKHRATIAVETLWGKPVANLQKELNGGESWVEEFKFPECGIFWVDMKVEDANGKLVKRLPQQFCAGIVPPQPAELSATNPMAYWADYGLRFSFDAPVRRMYICDKRWGMTAAMFEKQYEGYKSYIPGFRPYILLGANWVRPPQEGWEAGRKQNREWFETFVKSLKGKTIYGFENTSEPNNIDVKWYVQTLADMHEIFRNAGFDQPICPPGAAPPSLPMISDILKAGGHKYVNGVSYHPYSMRPIKNYRNTNSGKTLKGIISAYGKDMPMWNTESGFSPLPRIRNRPATTADAHAMRWPSREGMFLGSIGYFPELEGAAKCVQDVLINLLNGFSIYTHCSAPNVEGDPSLNLVALTALAGQIVNNYAGIESVNLADADSMCLLVKQTDGSRIAAVFGDKESMINFKVEANKTYKTMDLLGNYGTIKSDAGGMISVDCSMKPFFIFGVPADMSEIVSVKFDLPQAISDRGELKGKVTVENLFGRRIKGKLEAQKVRGAELSFSKTEVELNPGEKTEVEFFVNGKSLKRRPYAFTVLLKDEKGDVLASASKFADSPGTIHMVPQVKREMPLDGDVSKWKDIPAKVCDTEDDVVYGKPRFAEIWLPQWLGEEDLSFTAKTCWRKGDGIYFLLQVTDDVVLPAKKEQTGMAFRYDCLELFVDSRPVKMQTAAAVEGADQIIVIPSAANKAEKCDLWYSKKDRAHVKVECVGRKTATGWLIEGKISPNERTEFKVKAGSQFSMDFFVDDTDRDDEEKWLRKSAMALDGVYQNLTSPHLWGRYELQP